MGRQTKLEQFLAELGIKEASENSREERIAAIADALSLDPRKARKIFHQASKARTRGQVVTIARRARQAAANRNRIPATR